MSSKMNADIDLSVILHLGHMKSIDIYERGYYFIQLNLYYKTIHINQILTPIAMFSAPSTLNSIVKSTIISDNNIPINYAHIDDQTKSFRSRAFLIRYRDEEHELNEACRFQITIPNIEHYTNTTNYTNQFIDTDSLYLKAILYCNPYDEDTPDEAPFYNNNDLTGANNSNATDTGEWEIVAEQTIQITKYLNNSIHQYYPINFVRSRYMTVDCMIHTAIVGIRYPEIKERQITNAFNTLTEDAVDRDSKLPVNSTYSTTDSTTTLADDACITEPILSNPNPINKYDEVADDTATGIDDSDLSVSRRLFALDVPEASTPPSPSHHTTIPHPTDPSHDGHDDEYTKGAPPFSISPTRQRDTHRPTPKPHSPKREARPSDDTFLEKNSNTTSSAYNSNKVNIDRLLNFSLQTVCYDNNADNNDLSHTTATITVTLTSPSSSSSQADSTLPPPLPPQQPLQQAPCDNNTRIHTWVKYTHALIVNYGDTLSGILTLLPNCPTDLITAVKPPKIDATSHTTAKHNTIHCNTHNKSIYSSASNNSIHITRHLCGLELEDSILYNKICLITTWEEFYTLLYTKCIHVYSILCGYWSLFMTNLPSLMDHFVSVLRPKYKVCVTIMYMMYIY